jgi:hypothetical protein
LLRFWGWFRLVWADFIAATGAAARGNLGFLPLRNTLAWRSLWMNLPSYHFFPLTVQAFAAMMKRFQIVDEDETLASSGASREPSNGANSEPVLL